MSAPPKWRKAMPPTGAKSRRRGGIGYLIACLALYTLVMAGLRFYAHNIGVVGGLLTIVGMYGAVRWYENRRNVEILPEECMDDHGR
jgi:hypothetical protein